MPGEISPALFRAGDGEPVVLLHGFTGAWMHWRPVLADLAARYEVIAPTLAGHAGGPPLHLQEFSIVSGVDSLETHLDELGVGTAHFVGNSMGGAFAIELAKRGRARSVVALAPGGGWSPGHPDAERIARFFARQMRIIRASAPRARRLLARPSARRVSFRDIMRHGELIHLDDAVQLVEAARDCQVVEHVLQGIRDPHASTLADLDRVSAPVLLAWPEHDKILPLAIHSPRLRREIPGNEYRVLPGTGHVPMWDDPRLVTSTIVEWVDRHATGEPTAPHADAAEPAPA